MNQATTDLELPVRQQLEAYNARDIETFTKYWSEDAQIYEFPDRLLASGLAEIRERHVVRFQEADLHGKLHSRTSVANLVVDHETVTRTFPEGVQDVDVIAIYEVEGRKITKAWFKSGLPRPTRNHKLPHSKL